MEYVLGSLVTLICIAAVYPFIRSQVRSTKKINIHYTQSRNFSLVQPWASINRPYKELVTQSTRHHDKTSTRVVISNDKAYWIFNNELLQADVIDGKVDGNTTEKVDTMGMDNVQLDNLVFIVDKLTEGKSNEDPSTRD